VILFIVMLGLVACGQAPAEPKVFKRSPPVVTKTPQDDPFYVEAVAAAMATKRRSGGR
jgi:hypothetical protein